MGIDGLVAGDDVVASRAQLRELTAGLGGGDIHVDVRDIVDTRPGR